MTEADRWRQHAYDYGWRRVFLGDFKPVSPIDTEGTWYSADGAATAERFLRQILNKPAHERPHDPTSQDAVRPNWKTIPFRLLTDAERKIAEPLIAAMSAEAQRNIAAASKRWKEAHRDPYYRGKPAAEIPPPKGFERAKLSPERLDDLMGRLPK